MASQPFGSRPEAEHSATPSHSTIAIDLYTLRDMEFATDVPKEVFSEWEEKVCCEAVMSHDYHPLPADVKVTNNGRIENGLYSPEFYEYEDDLLAGTWEDGAKVIEGFHWNQPALEGQYEQKEEDSQVRDSAYVEEASLPKALLSDDASQDLQYTTRMGPNKTNLERAMPSNEEVRYVDPVHTTPQPSPPPTSHHDEPARITPPLSAPSKPYHEASDLLIPSSLSLIESSPSKATHTSGTFVDTALVAPLQADDIDGSTKHRPVPPSIHEDGGGLESISRDGLNVDDTTNAWDTYESTQENGIMIMQSTTPEAEPIRALPLQGHNDRSKETVANKISVDGQEGGQRPIGTEFPGQSQVQTSPSAANEPRPEDSNHLFDEQVEVRGKNKLAANGSYCEGWNSLRDYSEELEHKQPHDVQATTDVTVLQPVTAQPLDKCDQALRENMDVDVNTISELCAYEAITQPLLKDDMDAKISEQFMSDEQENLSPSPYKEYTDETPTFIEATRLSSNTTESKANIASPEVGIEVDSKSESATEEKSSLPPSRDELPAGSEVIDTPLLHSITPERRPTAEETVLKGISSGDESDAAAGVAQIIASSEATIVPSPGCYSGVTVLKLKIGSQIWNEATRASRHHDSECTSTLNDAAMAMATEARQLEDMTELLGKTTLKNSTDGTDRPVFDRMRVKGSPSMPSVPGKEGSLERSEPDQSTPWPGTLLEEQLVLPPSPYKVKLATGVMPDEMHNAELDTPFGMKAPVKTDLPAEPANISCLVQKRDTLYEAAELSHNPIKAETLETLSAPVCHTPGLIASFATGPEAIGPKTVPKKRVRPTTAKQKKTAEDSTAEYEPVERSGSEYEAPAKKKSNMPTEATTKLAVPPKQQRTIKGNKQTAMDDKMADWEDGDDHDAKVEKQMKAEPTASTDNGASTTQDITSDHPHWRAFETTYGTVQTRDEEELLVGAEPDAEESNTAPHLETKGKSKTNDKAEPVKATPVKAAQAVAPKTASRASRAKIPARRSTPKTLTASTSNTAGAEARRIKFGFKAPAGRKRKSTELNDAAEAPHLPSTQTKRQTRQASAAQEERQRQAEIESSVAKRTRGAQKK